MKVLGTVVVVNLFVITFFCATTITMACTGEKMSNGWCWPTGTSSMGNYLGFNKSNPNYGYRKHLAQDIDANEDDPVYAIADGKVLHSRNNVGGYGGLKNCSPTHADSIPGAGVIIEHRTTDGKKFIALYAHLKNVQVGATVVAGQKIGKIRNYTACGSRMDHLHFGIRFPAYNSQHQSNDDSHRWAGYELNGSYYHFIDPINFLNTHHPNNYLSSNNYINYFATWQICGAKQCDVNNQVFSNGDIVGWYLQCSC